MDSVIPEPLIQKLRETKLVGFSALMSFSENTTGQLWRKFMQRKKEILNVATPDLYSVEDYQADYFTNFNPQNRFKKWACAQVTAHHQLPEGMEGLTIPEGLYAVFIHKGSAGDGPRTYNYIFKVWLPDSKYRLDNRPHFAKMGSKYKNEDPDSEEELWIPISL